MPVLSKNKELFLKHGYRNKEAPCPTTVERYFRAAYMLTAGENCEEIDFDAALKQIHYRFDCCDFTMLFLIRLLYLYGESGLMSDEILRKLRAAVLDFDYWLTENYQFPSFKNMWTENHVMCYHVVEYLAACLYPNDIFRGRGLPGKKVKEIIKPMLLEWIDIKGKVGFSEWDSNTYAAINVESLLMLYDFAPDQLVREQTNKLLNILFVSLACNTHKGMYCCTHGRAYSDTIKDEEKASIYPLLCLVWNVGDITKEMSFSASAFFFSTSAFQPDPLILNIFDEIANTSAFESFEQASFDVEDAHLFGKGYESEEDMALYWHNMAYTHKLVIDNMWKLEQKYHICVNDLFTEKAYYYRCKKEGVSPDVCRSPNYLPRVNKVNYKTKDYMLSTAQDFRKGYKGFQQHIWQASLDMRAVVFVNHPGDYSERQGRPDFWCGNGVMPRATQYKNVGISIYRNNNPYLLPFTHAYFPKNQFDEVVECGNWIVAKKGNGYCALYSQNGYSWSQRKNYEQCEIVCNRRNNIWICQMGNKEEYGGFSEFVASLLASELRFINDGVQYQSPHGLLQLEWEGDFTLDGNIIPLKGYKRFENPYCVSEYGSGVYRLQCGEKIKTITF